MKPHERQHEQGFTLVELIASIGASAIIMLTVMSLMGMTHREWIKGMDRRDLTSEMVVTMDKITRETRSAKVDSVAVSATGDTLKLGTGKRFYTDGAHTLIFQGAGQPFPYLEGMVTDFTASAPVILAPGDTLQNAVKVTLVTQNNDVQDSTSVLIRPRAQ